MIHVVAYREMRHCVSLPLRLRPGSSCRKPRRPRTCQQCSRVPHSSPLELTSQQVPVIWTDGYVSVCFFDICQPERDLSCLRLLTHESFEVRCNWCPLLITEMGGGVDEVSVRSVEDHPRRYNSSWVFFLLRTEARDHQVRESVSHFDLRHDQYLTSSLLVTENFLHLGTE